MPDLSATGNSSLDKLEQLIPELRPLRQNGSLLSNAIQCFGDINDFLIASLLFWPNFHIQGPYFFLEPVSTDVLARWLGVYGEDHERVEKMLNHRHLANMFANASSVVSSEKLCFLGRILKDMWERKLEHDFPSHDFAVLLGGLDSPDPSDITISFFAKREQKESESVH
jgi:hypothetical protein